VVHAVEPLFRALGASITTFHGSAEGYASSVAHDLIKLWLSRALTPGSGDISSLYDRASLIFHTQSLPDARVQADAARLFLDFLQRDAARLPSQTVIRYLTAAMGLPGEDERVPQLVLEVALSALEAGQADDNQRQALAQVASDALSAARARSLPVALEMWVTLHSHGAAYAPLFGADPAAFMAEIARSNVRETHPGLLQRAFAVMTASYPGTPTTAG
jgi:hypothetical protein